MEPMSETTTATADRYRRLSDRFADLVAGVPDDRWTQPTPCDDWTVRDLVAHVVETPVMFFSMVDRPFEVTVAVADDPVAAFEQSRRLVQAELDDPDRAGAEFEGFFGRTNFAAAIDRFACMDLVVHGWDLARATGQSDRMDPTEVERLTASVASFGDTLRSPGVCGPEVPVADDADPQTKLLGLLGREAVTV